MMDAILNPQISLDGQHFLPLSDAAMRLMQFHEGGDSVGFMCNNGGFFCMLAALIITGASVENLITERPQGLLKQGIPPVPPFTSVDLEMRSVKAFKNLRRISLCLDSPSSAGPGFPSCLEAADQLEHLEISVTYASMPSLYGRLNLPNGTSFMKLRTFVLESATFAKENIVEFLLRRAQSLIHVALWDCHLVEGGTWKAVVQALAEAESVKYESFILKSPKDDPIHLGDSVAVARIESEVLLRFINEGGIDINPFEHRRYFQPDDFFDILPSHASDYSDISNGSALEWLGRTSLTETQMDQSSTQIGTPMLHQIQESLLTRIKVRRGYYLVIIARNHDSTTTCGMALGLHDACGLHHRYGCAGWSPIRRRP